MAFDEITKSAAVSLGAALGPLPYIQSVGVGRERGRPILIVYVRRSSKGATVFRTPGRGCPFAFGISGGLAPNGPIGRFFTIPGRFDPLIFQLLDQHRSESAEVEMPERDDIQAIEELSAAYGRIVARLGEVIVGQREVIEELLVAMFARGHCLLVGVPGLAKTLLIRTLAETLSLEFRRIQFTPDLMPADITGTEVIQEDRRTGTREFRFLKGPIFGNVILADEINRTPPKTQAALLEAMQEHQITVGGQRHALSEPFFVLATQNPIEHEGTYPLPEAQLDRFMFNTHVDYPEEEEEFDIVRRTTTDVTATVTPVLSGEQIVALQRIVRRVPVADHVVRYAMRLVRRTRPGKNENSGGKPDTGKMPVLRRMPAPKRNEVPPFVREYVAWGAGPRASQYLVLGAKARAALQGRFHAGLDNVPPVALPVLRHRLVTNFNAEAEGIKPDDLICRLIEAVDAEQSGDNERLPPVFRREG